MTEKRLFSIPLLVVAGLALPHRATAQFPLPNYKQIATIAIPGGLASFDISWVDSANGRYYLADRTATKGTGRIDVIDTRQNTFLYSIPQTKGEVGFAGNTGSGATSGPNGVVAIPYLNQLYVGDGDSTVKVVDLTAKAIIASIHTGGLFRADELAYDPLDHIVMIGNPNDSPPYLTLISTDTQTVLGKIFYPSSQTGLEQPVWDGQIRRFLISVPATAVQYGGVDAIDPVAMAITNHFTTFCSPAGLALGPLQRVMTSCGQEIDARSGRYLNNSLTLSIPIGGDEIWFNPGDNRYYFGSANVAVVDAETSLPLGYLALGVPTHSIAVDSQTNSIFVPATGIGVEVFMQTGP